MSSKQLSLLTPIREQEQGGGPCSFIQALMGLGPDLAVSVSGGKDSDAMLRYLVDLHRGMDWKGGFYALFCDLGRIEWAGVSEHLKCLCRELDVPLLKLYPKRGMIEEWQHRYETILARQEDKPFWSSSASRYCTKHTKTQRADKQLRRHDFVVCAIGIRAQESSGRARKPRFQVRDDIASTWYKTPRECRTAQQKEVWAEEAFQRWLDSGRRGRCALTWHPILQWDVDQVWGWCGSSGEDVADRRGLYQAGRVRDAIAGFPCHWAYISGNSRLSCSMCVLASAGDVFNGARLNPWTWAELALMEVVGGWGFQQGRWLASLSAQVMGPSFRQRDRLHRVLGDLELVTPQTKVDHHLLLQCPQGCIALWTEEAFSAIAQAVADCWQTSTSQG